MGYQIVTMTDFERSNSWS